MVRQFGHQGWWPGETPFEVCVGAILTQNTSWTNVERALENLKRHGPLTPQDLYSIPLPTLSALLRPAGYFNIKAQRLRSFLHVLVNEFEGRLDRLLEGPTHHVRQRLLNIHGIGRETADSILLYAGNHESFVIDAYTRRIFERHRWIPHTHGGSDARKAVGTKPSKTNPAQVYEDLKKLCEISLSQPSIQDRLDYWQDYHAQLVMVGKHYCRTANPRCGECPLKPLLPQ